MNSNKNSKSLNITGVRRSRKIGQNMAMIVSIKTTIEQGGKAAVAGCQDPSEILRRLKALGVLAVAEEMTVTTPMKTVHNLNSIEGEVIGLTGGLNKATGFVFYCNNSEPSLNEPKGDVLPEGTVLRDTDPCPKCSKPCVGRSCHDCQKFW